MPQKKVKGAKVRSLSARQSQSRRSRNGKTSAISPPALSSRLTGFSETWAPLFAAKTRRRLRYSSNFTLASASGVVSSYVLAANGMFDPDVTGTGHQPMGFDQMMLSYEHYTVISARLTCTFRNTAATNPTVSITVAPSPTPITVIDQILEFGLLAADTLQYKGVDGSCLKLVMPVSIKKLNGAGNILDFNVLRGDVANNPAEITYFIVQMWDTSAATAGCIVDYTIEFDSWFTEPRELSESLRKLVSLSLRADAAETKHA